MKRIIDWFQSLNTMMVLAVINLAIFCGLGLAIIVLKFFAPSMYPYTPPLVLAVWICSIIYRKYMK